MTDKKQRSRSLRKTGDGEKDVSTDRPSRRRAIAGLAAGGSLYAARHTWVKPVIEVVELPVHAQASANNMTPSFSIHGDSDPVLDYSFGPGDHELPAIDGDDAYFSFRATLDPPPSGQDDEPSDDADAPEVTLLTDGHSFYDPGDWTDTQTARSNADGLVEFSDLDIGYLDEDDSDPVLTATFSAPGYTTTRITVTFVENDSE